MFNMSADTVFNYANWVLLASLVIGVVATYAIVRSGKIKDKESKLEVSRATESAAIANENAAIANKKAVFLDKERLMLEARIAPRRLTSEMQSAIATSLKSFSGRTVVIKSYTLDVESVGLGQQIIDALKLANITAVNQLLSVSAFNSANVGVHITGQDKDLTARLIQSLSSNGHLVVSDQVIRNTAPHGVNIVPQMSDVPNVAATIFIGIKPLQQ